MDKSVLIALMLSALAGLSTIIGAAIIFFNKQSKKVIAFSLGFSAGVMICISFTDLFTSAENIITKKYGTLYGTLITLGFMGAGALTALLIDEFIPKEKEMMQANKNNEGNLYRVGIVTMIAITLHNFPEGVATFISGYQNTALGITIALAIAMHNIPEGIAVAAPVYYSTGSKLKALKLTFISGISEPIGALLAFLVLKPFISDFLLGIIFSFVMGIMLYISFEELLPSAYRYKYDRLTLASVFLGIFIIPVTHIFIG